MCVAMTDVLDLRLLDSLRDMTDLTIKPSGRPERHHQSIELLPRHTSNKDARLMATSMTSGNFAGKQEEVTRGDRLGGASRIVKLVNLLIATRCATGHESILSHGNELVVRYA